QHVELTRDIAERFNNKYGPTFRVPEPLIPKVGARIMSLSEPTKKMSKSDESNKGCIYLLDDPKAASKKIMSAVTDLVGMINYDPENQPGVSNLLTILSCLGGTSIPELVKQFEGQGYGNLKKAVANEVVKLLEMLQSRYRDIIKSGVINEVLLDGQKKASVYASKKLHEVELKIGADIR
ncbi:MAG: tryptophan--tRNA ligase, partial [Erysipelotrichaceae bacterium]